MIFESIGIKGVYASYWRLGDGFCFWWWFFWHGFRGFHGFY